MVHNILKGVLVFGCADIYFFINRYIKALNLGKMAISLAKPIL